MKVTIKDDVMRNKIKDTLIRIELLKSLQQENKQLKEVIEEVRECIKEYSCYDEETKQFCFDIETYRLPSLLQILDKGGQQ